MPSESEQEAQTIRVNFGRPMPVFPLHGVVLLPHAVLPLHIFEPRYRQMVDHALDGAGQVAMGVFEGDQWRQEYHGMPPIRPMVCVGQIVQHERLPDGRYNILLQGVCRARITDELPPDADRMYRAAALRPTESKPADDTALPGVRERLRGLFSERPLKDLTAAQGISGVLQSTAAPTIAVLELISASIISDNELKYRLLAEPDAASRAELIEHELKALRSLLARAEKQLDPKAPKGVVWN